MVYYSRYFASFIVSIPLPEIIKYPLSLVSNLTLDIYIVQIVIINSLGMKLSFPISILVLFVTIFIAAFLNNYFAKLLRKGITLALP